MTIRKKRFWMILIACISLLGCESQTVVTTSSQVSKNIKPKDAIYEKIKAMTLDEKIGQLVIAGVEGTSMTLHNQELLLKDQVGGLIIMGGNVKNADQLKGMINMLKRTHQSKKIPLFISADEEGGRVSRMPPELLKLPSNERIGKMNQSALSYKVGTLLATELKSFGFNMNFGPVLDINSNPNNPVIGDRSFSNQPDVVATLGIRTMKGMQNHRMISVVKHFPGHGDTETDSHLALPIVNASLKRLQSFELRPFQEAIIEGADGVMVAHILLKSIDSQHPASLSKQVITDLLREQLQFDGVVFTDDLTMKAITDHYGIGAAAVQSIQAGADVVLVCHNYQNVKTVLQALKKAVDTQQISMKRLDESVARILRLKGKYEITDKVTGPVPISELNKEIVELRSIIK